ncbi:MAG: hypothetical protein KC503_03100 [Myxococcales bacterium]|nr:hypothetical protein [Myxococcales bacterium]
MSRALAAAALALTTVAALASCVRQTFPEGLECDGAEERCPEGQRCVAGHCRLVSSLDATPGDLADSEADGETDGAADALCRGSPCPCVPLEVDQCDPDYACYMHTAGTGVCLRFGSQRFGEPCTQLNQCVPGFGCHIGVCQQYCDPRLNGQRCTEVDNALCKPLSSKINVGICLPR